MSVLPDELISSLKKLGHFDEPAFRAVHASGEQAVSVRFNPAKIRIEAGQWPAAVSPPFRLAERIPWSETGYYLSERPSFTLDPVFHAGAYYVQEASGLFLEQALRQMMDLSKPVRVLDLCAAPGGKSTLMQSLVSRDSLLLANEVIKSRVPVLHQNLVKWGLPNGFISHNDPEAFGRLPGFFDLLLVDAPCSGSGLFRRDPAAAGEWSAEAVKLCSRRQQRILTGAWPSLKENGILIYSTCSYSPEENEEQVDHLLGHFNCESLRLAIDPAWNIVETLSPKANGYGYRFYPDKLKGEGFFLAVLRKKEGTARLPDSRQKPEWPDKKEETLLRKFIPDQNLRFIRIGEGIHVLPAPLIQVLPLLKERLYLKKAGVLAGRMARDEWIPDHELALCTALDPGMPGLELPVAGALHYLRRETLVPPVAGKGWLPVRFQGLSLGWAKLLSGRINNYYPKSWRILH